MPDPRILIYDIETSPLVGYAWRTYDTSLVKVKKEWQILTVAWKWEGEKKVHALSLPDFHGYRPLEEDDDFGLVGEIAYLFEEADVVVAHNGNRFDQPKVQARMLIHGMPPTSPYKEVDTLQLVRRNFRLTSNRLGDVAKAIGIAQKGSPGGIECWDGCMEGDPKAWAKMVKYNKQDVVVLEQLFHRVRPWAQTGLPNIALLSDRPDVCPKCGSNKGLIARGWRYRNVTKARAYQCLWCGGYCQGRQIIKSDASHV